MKILVLNCGSSSLKYQLINMETEEVLASGKYERIGEEEAFITHKAQGKKVGLIGTVANYICGKNLGESSRTTPDSLELQKLFSDMVEAGAEYAIMEVSSQALKLHRVDGCDFDIGVFFVTAVRLIHTVYMICFLNVFNMVF